MEKPNIVTADGYVNVVNSAGQLFSIPQDQMAAAMEQNYRIASPEELTKHFEREQYSSPSAQALAGLAASVRGPTMGLSDLMLTKSGLVEPETLSKLREYNPATSTVGELGGIAASMLTGAGEASLIGNAARMVGAPVRAATRLGQVGGEAVGAMAPQFLGSVGQRALQGAAAGAIEGGVFGAGTALTDYALGEPNVTAQKVISDIGIGALIGLPVGAVGKVIEGALVKTGQPKSVLSNLIDNEAIAANREAETKRALQNLDFQKLGTEAPTDIAEKLKIKQPEGIPSYKPEVLEAAKQLDLPVPAGFATTDPFVNRAVDALNRKSPSFAGVYLTDQYEKAWTAMMDKLEAIIPTTRVDIAETGSKLRSELADKMRAMYEPIRNTYDAMKEVYPRITLSERSAPAISRAILGIPEAVQAPNSAGGQFARGIAKDILNTKTFDDIAIHKATARDAMASPDPNVRRLAKLIWNKLDRWEESSINRVGRNLKTNLAKETVEKQQIFKPVVDRIDGLLQLRKQAKEMYKPFIEDISYLSEQLGKGRVYGPEDAIKFIEQLDAETVVKKLARKDESEFRNWFAKNFAPQMDTLRNYEKSKLRIDTSPQGVLSPKTFFNRIDKLADSHQATIFSQQEINQLKNLKQYLKGFPEKWNPSDTAHTSAFLQFFESPTKAVAANIRDTGLFLRIIKDESKLPPELRRSPEVLGEELARRWNVFNGISRMVRRFDDSVVNILKGGKTLTTSALVGYELDNAKSYDQSTKRIKELANDPQMLFDQMNANVDEIASEIPNVAPSVSTSLLNSIQFLNSKIPGPKNPQQLDAQYVPSAAQKQKFMRYYDALNNPLSVIKDVKNGTINMEAIEALQSGRPELYEHLKQIIDQQLPPDIIKKMNESQKRSMAMFLGKPLKSNQLQPVMAANQAAFAQINMNRAAQQNALMGKTTLGGLKELDIAKNKGTRTDRGPVKREV